MGTSPETIDTRALLNDIHRAQRTLMSQVQEDQTLKDYLDSAVSVFVLHFKRPIVPVCADQVKAVRRLKEYLDGQR